MRKVRFARAAAADLEAIGAYLNQHNLNASRKMTLEIYDTCMSLRSLPDRGRPGKVRGTRELLINSWPYVAVYRVEPDNVQILRVFHMAQHRQW